ncbi:MAG TPA: 1-phosphofructokinase [Ktedonobacterales bacterium]
MASKVDVVTITLNPAIDQTLSIPHFTAGAVNRVAHAQLDAGGKGVNVAAALADDGVGVAVTGFLGEENDEIFRGLFARKGIVDRFVRIKGVTRTGVKVVDPILRQTTDINFPGQMPAPDDISTLLQTVEELAAASGWFVISGSIPESVAPTIYRDLIQRLTARGKRVVLDTSGPPLRPALTAGPYLIKPNVAELRELLDESLDTEGAILRAARTVAREYGIGCVVVSMGEEGSISVEGADAVRAIPGHVDVVSTVGAGDTMLAGMVAGKLRGAALADCARLATAFAMGAIAQLGAGLPQRSLVEDLMRQVTIRTLGTTDETAGERASSVSLSQPEHAEAER